MPSGEATPPVLASEYLGFVAGQTGFPNFLASTGALKQMQSISRHKATDDITTLYSVAESSYVLGGGSETAAGNADITAAITDTSHNLLGVFKWSGVSTVTIAGGSRAVSDGLAVTIPNGTEFFYKEFRTLAGAGNPVFIDGISGSYRNESVGERLSAAASGLTDLTQSGATFTSNQSTNLRYAPAALVGLTRKATFIVFGTSRAEGRGPASDSKLGKGNICRRLVDAGIGHTNFGISSDTITAFRTSSSKRRSYAQYASHAIFEQAINDTFASRTAAQIKADLEVVIPFVVAVLQTPKHIGCCAVEPRVTAHAGATPATGESERVLHNANSRTLAIVGQTFHVELADQVETSRDAGTWASSTYETDGTHETNAGADLAGVGVPSDELTRSYPA